MKKMIYQTLIKAQPIPTAVPTVLYQGNTLNLFSNTNPSYTKATTH